MNILFLSKRHRGLHAGTSYSIPAQICAQAEMDCVFWYNLVSEDIAEWKSFPFYHDLKDYPREAIRLLPEPFSRPDFVVVECLYDIASSKILWELLFGKIPYIIIPRCSLTGEAQKKHALKKRLVNTLLYRRFIRKAAAIQYLTEQEHLDSGDGWNKTNLIIPNGITLPKAMKESAQADGISCISIGRIEPFQKGLDLLIEACGMIKKELEAAHCIVSLYGPERDNSLPALKRQASAAGLEGIVKFCGPVYGQDKEALLLKSDVFVMTSRFEGHPMGLLEAMAYGLPCLVTTGSNMRKEIEKHDAGWTADTEVESIRGALLAMLRDRPVFSEKGKRARELARAYEWASVAQQTHEALSTLKDR